jgi:hypothetical protein
VPPPIGTPCHRQPSHSSSSSRFKTSSPEYCPYLATSVITPILTPTAYIFYPPQDSIIVCTSLTPLGKKENNFYHYLATTINMYFTFYLFFNHINSRGPISQFCITRFSRLMSDHSKVRLKTQDVSISQSSTILHKTWYITLIGLLIVYEFLEPCTSQPSPPSLSWTTLPRQLVTLAPSRLRPILLSECC